MAASITVEGIPIRAIGCQITYAHSDIPYAMVSFDPNNSDILTNSDDLRQTPVTVTLSTDNGNLQFNGLFDGISFVQSPGAFSYQAVIKSQFQKLHYIYPRITALNPISVPLTRVGMTEVEFDSGLGPRLFPGGYHPAKDENVIDTFINVMREVIAYQQNITDVNAQADSISLRKVLGNRNYKKDLEEASALFAAIDTSAVKNISLDKSLTLIIDSLLQLLNAPQQTIWGTLLAGLQELGCVAIVANSKIFVVPENSFLLLPHTDPAFQQKSTKPNLAYPAQYNTLSFNDNGFRDVGSCYIYTPARLPTVDVQNLMWEVGSYVDPAAKTGAIVVLEAPVLVQYGFSGDLIINSQKVAQNIKEGQGNRLTSVDKVKEPNDAVNDKTKKHDDSQERLDSMIGKYNNLAQIKYYQLKYGDRGGSLSTEFNPNWCPGSSAAIYSRYPDMYVDCYVDSVTHSITVSPTNTGTATTQVNFSSGRAGLKNAGVTTDDLYNYTSEKMQEIQSAFVKDVVGG